MKKRKFVDVQWWIRQEIGREGVSKICFSSVQSLSLGEHKFIILQLLRVRCLVWSRISSAEIKVLTTTVISSDGWGPLPSSLIVGGIQFPVDISLKSSFSFGLLRGLFLGLRGRLAGLRSLPQKALSCLFANSK